VIRHIVLFKVKEDVDARGARVQEAFDGLEKLGGVVPELRAWQVGRNVNPRPVAYDFALVSEVDDLDALQRYVDHPGHQAVVALLREVCTWVSVDLEVPTPVDGP
jgi:hypothetical protein